MKNFLYQTFKLLFLLLVAFGIVGGVAFYNFQNKNLQNVFAANTGESGSTDVTGYGWSENIGWISFNGDQISGGSTYGVGIKEIDIGGGNTIGRLSGHAWSENIGWISFNRADTGAPPNNDVGSAYSALAIIDSSNRLQGWARATTACDNNSDGDCVDSGSGEGVGAGTNSGGWDGWIRFNNGSTYGITLVPQTGTSYFNGWGWGSDVIGWISANRRNCDTDNNGQSNGGAGCPAAGTAIPPYAINTNFELNLPPNAPSALSVSPQKYCSSYNSVQTYLGFNWTFSDPNLNSSNYQSDFKIELSYINSLPPGNTHSIVSDIAYAPGMGTYTVVSPPSGTSNPQNFTQLGYLSDIKNNLGDWYGRTLYWRVTVWDNGTYPKSTTSGTQTYGPMPDREYPYVTFYSNPTLDKIFAKQDVQFSPDQFSTDDAKCYSSGVTEGPCSSYSWSFSGTANPSPTSSTQKEPVVNFGSGGSSTATLTITDGAGNSCQATRSGISIGLPLPEIKEKK